MSQYRSLMGLMDDTRRQMEYLVGEALGTPGEAMSGGWRPPTDVYECDDCLVIKMEVGGLRTGDTEITLEGDLLTIRGSRKDDCPREKKVFHQMEVRYGRFEKRIRIQGCFDDQNIEARIENGFLTLVILKCQPPKQQPSRASFRV